MQQIIQIQKQNYNKYFDSNKILNFKDWETKLIAPNWPEAPETTALYDFSIGDLYIDYVVHGNNYLASCFSSLAEKSEILRGVVTFFVYAPDNYTHWKFNKKTIITLCLKEDICKKHNNTELVDIVFSKFFAHRNNFCADAGELSKHEKDFTIYFSDDQKEGVGHLICFNDV